MPDRLVEPHARVVDHRVGKWDLELGGYRYPIDRSSSVELRATHVEYPKPLSP